MRKIQVNPNGSILAPDGRIYGPGKIIPVDVPRAVVEDWVKSGHARVINADGHEVQGQPFDPGHEVPGQDVTALETPSAKDDSAGANAVRVQPEAKPEPEVRVTGKWDFAPEDLEDKALDDLNALIAERWDQDDVEAPIYEDRDEAVAHLGQDREEA